MMDKDNTNPAGNEIDLLEILRNIYSNRKFLIKSILITFFIGVAIASITPKKYTSGTVFVPMVSSRKPSGGALGGLASLAGINLSGSTEGSDIAPNLYPEIVESIPFRQELAEVKIPFEGKLISYREYYKVKPKGVLAFLKKYTIGLPSLILNSLHVKNLKVITLNDNNVAKGEKLISFSDEDYGFYNQFDNLVTIDLKEGYIELSVVFDNPVGAAIIAKKSLEILQKKVIEFKIKQATEVLKYAQQQLVVKKAILYEAQMNLSTFKDRNLFISNSTFQNQLLRIESEYNNSNVVYQEVAKQVEESKLQVSKDTPIFSILKPVVVPNISISNNMLTIEIWSFIGLIFGVFKIIFSESVIRFYHKLK